MIVGIRGVRCLHNPASFAPPHLVPLPMPAMASWEKKGRGKGSEPRATKIYQCDIFYTYLRLMFVMLPKQKTRASKRSKVLDTTRLFWNVSLFCGCSTLSLFPRKYGSKATRITHAWHYSHRRSVRIGRGP